MIYYGIYCSGIIYYCCFFFSITLVTLFGFIFGILRAASNPSRMGFEQALHLFT
jgi:hypothetical protein